MATAHIIHDKLIKPSGNTAHILIPKKFIGKRAKVIIENNDEKTGDKNECKNRR